MSRTSPRAKQLQAEYAEKIARQEYEGQWVGRTVYSTDWLSFRAHRVTGIADFSCRTLPVQDIETGEVQSFWARELKSGPEIRHIIAERLKDLDDDRSRISCRERDAVEGADRFADGDPEIDGIKTALATVAAKKYAEIDTRREGLAAELARLERIEAGV